MKPRNWEFGVGGSTPGSCDTLHRPRSVMSARGNQGSKRWLRERLRDIDDLTDVVGRVRQRPQECLVHAHLLTADRHHALEICVVELDNAVSSTAHPGFHRSMSSLRVTALSTNSSSRLRHGSPSVVRNSVNRDRRSPARCQQMTGIELSVSSARCARRSSGAPGDRALYPVLCIAGTLPGPSQSMRACSGDIASTRTGLPLPPTIFNGAAMTMAPTGGSLSRLVGREAELPGPVHGCVIRKWRIEGSRLAGVLDRRSPLPRQERRGRAPATRT